MEVVEVNINIYCEIFLVLIWLNIIHYFTGNLNNFEDKDQCESVCSVDNSEEDDDSEEKDEEGIIINS